MNIVEQLQNIFSLNSIEISERAKILQSSFEIEAIKIPRYEKLVELFSFLPKRDKWKISLLDANENRVDFLNQEDEFSEKYNHFVSELEDEEQINVSIEVNKEVDENVFSIYCFKSFSENLLSKNIEEIMLIFSGLLKKSDYLTLLIYDEDIFFTTNTMTFISGDKSPIKKNLSRDKRLVSCRETSYFYNMNDFELLPDDFMIESDFENNPLSDLFNKITTLLSIVYIASTSYIENHCLKGQINGQRNIEFSYNVSDITENNQLYKIFNWIYTDGNSIDKAIIARNIISLHCRYTRLIDTDEKTYSSIQSNFKLYLKDNVTQYVELKNKLAEFICDVVAKVGDNATALLGNFKTNLIAIFGFIFSIILVNIVSEQPLNNIFTKDITAILEVVLLGSIAYLSICIFETNYKLKKTIDSYNLLKSNYKSILSDLDIQEVFQNDKMIIDAKKSIRNGLIIYSLIWGVSLIIAFIIIENVSDYPIIINFFKK